MRGLVIASVAAGMVGLAAAQGRPASVVVEDNEPPPTPEPAGQLDEGIPLRLTNVIGHPDYRPDFMRVGVRIDGKERNDIIWYDVGRLEYLTLGQHKLLTLGGRKEKALSIEPFWRFEETRQMRRARERWEAGRK